ncbi:MAG TPA: DUF459 domain-containing protein [Chloroflexota bacterium]|nr:DUF459 domain-containing protein [Chloroflexota bacterium]
MSALVKVRDEILHTPRPASWPGAEFVGPDSPAVDGEQPTTSVWKLLLSLVIGLVLTVILGARGLIHAGNGMDYGTERDITLSVGNAALRIETALHLTFPWDQAEIALGRAPQPALPPLLASGIDFPTSLPRATETPVPPERHRGLAVARIGLRPSPTLTPTVSVVNHRGPSSGPTIYPTHEATATRTIAPATATPSRTPTSTPRPTHTAIKRYKTPRPHGVGTPVVPRSSATPGSGKSRKHHLARTYKRLPLPTPTSTPIAQLRPLTAADPLRLLVTGDSLTGYLGPILINEAASAGPVRGFVDTHNGTGLTRPDFVDWSLVAQQQVAAYHPDAVVVMMGGNDFQNMTLPNGAFFQAGTPAWTKEYERRAAICMRIWSQGGKSRVYWLSMPPARDPSWAYDDGKINVALEAAAALVPGAEYVNILGPVTKAGHYTDFIYDHGQAVLIREVDGVHLNVAGSTIVANEMLTRLEREWRFGPKGGKSGA